MRTAAGTSGAPADAPGAPADAPAAGAAPRPGTTHGRESRSTE